MSPLMFWVSFAFAFGHGFCQTDAKNDGENCQSDTCGTNGQAMLQIRKSFGLQVSKQSSNGNLTSLSCEMCKVNGKRIRACLDASMTKWNSGMTGNEAAEVLCWPVADGIQDKTTCEDVIGATFCEGELLGCDVCKGEVSCLDSNMNSWGAGWMGDSARVCTDYAQMGFPTQEAARSNCEGFSSTAIFCPGMTDLTDNGGYCKKGYYRGNCKGKSGSKSAEDLAACASLEACKAQCAKEDKCKFLVYKSNVCSRYDDRAGDCNDRANVGSSHQVFRKD